MSRAEEESSSPRPFRLSALLGGHTDDVRALAAGPSSRLISGSRDGTARTWARTGVKEGRTGGWEEESVLRDHEGFVNSVAWLPPREDDAGVPKGGYLVSGGLDALIYVRDFPEASSAPSPAPRQTLSGHSGNVCSLHASSDGRRLVSGSWDATARVWDTRDWSCSQILVGHQAAVWDALAIEGKGYEDTVLTASADCLIRLFKGAECKVVFKGHTEAVRALAKVLPEDEDGSLFASASNDGTVRIWNLQGDAITTLEGHDSFIYTIVSLPSASGGGLASSGEEGIVKIWNDEDGEEEQEILVPALSVWTLAALPNGDLAIGCSKDPSGDCLVWVFTRDEARGADAACIKDYDERMAQRPKRAAKAEALPLATVEDLTQPGTEGKVKLVKIEGVTQAFQWTESSWVKLGEVVDQALAAAARPKTIYEGVEYDFVLDVDVKDDEPPLRLAFNLEDDSQEVAVAFQEKHALPLSYVDQIREFVEYAK